MSRSREDRDVSVTEDGSRYVQATEGPVDDTIVHTRQTPGIVPDSQAPPPATVRRDPVEDPDRPDIRKSTRKPEEVEHHRVKRVRASNPVLVGVLLFLLIVGIGGTALMLAVKRDHPAPPAPAPPPAEIGGVPVRHGMKGGVE